MNSYKFRAFGHPNIRGTHQTTLEFTKEYELSLKGDCIIGVRSDFSSHEIKDFLGYRSLRMVLEIEGISDEIKFKPNKGFSSDKEMVIRKGHFVSDRTLGLNSDKASSEIKREILEKMKNPDSILNITLENESEADTEI